MSRRDLSVCQDSLAHRRRLLRARAAFVSSFGSGARLDSSGVKKVQRDAAEILKGFSNRNAFSASPEHEVHTRKKTSCFCFVFFFGGGRVVGVLHFNAAIK